MACCGFAVPPDNIVIFSAGRQCTKRKKITRKTTLFSAGNQALQHKRTQLSLEVRGVWGEGTCQGEVCL